MWRRKNEVRKILAGEIVRWTGHSDVYGEKEVLRRIGKGGKLKGSIRI